MKTKTRTLSTQLQIKHAKAGVYSIKGASGFGFKKDSDTVGVGSYTVRFRLGGRRPTMGLGAFSEISLADAREAAGEAVRLARKGVDPIEQRRREKAANLAAERAKQPVTFARATQSHLEAHARDWKHKYAHAAWFNPLKKYGLPILGELPVNEIRPEHVAAVVRAAAADGNSETGRRVRQRIKKVIDGAIARGERDATRGNPADAGLIGAIVPLKRKGEPPHFRGLSLAAAPTAFSALREARTQATGLKATAIDAWQFAILTTARPGEALRCRWAGIDLVERVWRLSPEETKSSRAHAVPLSGLAIGILERRAAVPTGDYVFAGRGGSPLSHSYFNTLPGTLGLDLGTAHAWRAVWRGWTFKIGRIDRDLAEFQLQHALPATEAAYLRERGTELRRGPLEAFARWLVGDAGADVIDIGDRRATTRA